MCTEEALQDLQGGDYSIPCIDGALRGVVRARDQRSTQN